MFVSCGTKVLSFFFFVKLENGFVFQTAECKHLSAPLAANEPVASYSTTPLFSALPLSHSSRAILNNICLCAGFKFAGSSGPDLAKSGSLRFDLVDFRPLFNRPFLPLSPSSFFFLSFDSTAHYWLGGFSSFPSISSVVRVWPSMPFRSLVRFHSQIMLFKDGCKASPIEENRAFLIDKHKRSFLLLLLFFCLHPFLLFSLSFSFSFFFCSISFSHSWPSLPICL